MSGRAAAMVVVVLALGVGCAKRPATTTASAPAPTGEREAVAGPTPSVTSGTRPSGRATDVSRAAARQAPSEFRAMSDLVDVHFEFDRAELRSDALGTIEANARVVHGQAGSLVLIEGHCDERGTSEYNLALGERRARATMNALVARGVDAHRISVVSYGEDRPQCTERTETCWAKNRRAHFKLKPR